MPTPSPKVLVVDVSVTFASRGAAAVLALDHVSLEVAGGEFLCIVGPSGSGKSTLLRVLAGLLRQSAGTVEIRAEQPGTPLTAMVFQEHALLPWRTVRDNVTFGLENRGVGRAEREARAQEMLALVGLTRFARHYPHQLSGGMKQRVGIARALANDPEVLLMDEPLAALDAQTRTIMQEELLRIWSTLGKTVIYVTHSLEEALLLGDRVVLLTARPGRVSQIFPVELGRPRGLEVRGIAGVRHLAREDLVPPARGGRPRHGGRARRGVTVRRCAGWLAEHWIAVGSPLVVLAAWEWASAAGLLREAFFPRPSTILVHLRRLATDGTLWHHASATLGRIAWAFALAAVLGVTVGLAMGFWRRLREGLDPVFAVIYPIPERAVPAARELRAAAGRGGRRRHHRGHGVLPDRLHHHARRSADRSPGRRGRRPLRRPRPAALHRAFCCPPRCPSSSPGCASVSATRSSSPWPSRSWPPAAGSARSCGSRGRS